MDEVATPTVQPISDDQELAEALAGVTKQAESNLNFEETPVAMPDSDSDQTNSPEQSETVVELDDTPATEPVVESTTPVIPAMPEVESSDDLDGIKKDALIELRPLVDKLNLSAEEKFDIYLLLLRNTDDKTLIAPAHKAAQEIADETRRAQALLDIIKEIDYLSNPAQATV